MLKWQVESLSQEVMRAPEVKNALASADKATDAAAGISAVAKHLPEQVAAERSAALDQFFTNLREARSAAVEDIGKELDEQRVSLIADLAGAQEKLAGTLHEYGDAAKATR